MRCFSLSLFFEITPSGCALKIFIWGAQIGGKVLMPQTCWFFRRVRRLIKNYVQLLWRCWTDAPLLVLGSNFC